MFKQILYPFEFRLEILKFSDKYQKYWYFVCQTSIFRNDFTFWENSWYWSVWMCLIALVCFGRRILPNVFGHLQWPPPPQFIQLHEDACHIVSVFFCFQTGNRIHLITPTLFTRLLFIDSSMDMIAFGQVAGLYKDFNTTHLCWSGVYNFVPRNKIKKKRCWGNCVSRTLS